jgi:hypothetical protein
MRNLHLAGALVGWSLLNTACSGTSPDTLMVPAGSSGSSGASSGSTSGGSNGGGSNGGAGSSGSSGSGSGSGGASSSGSSSGGPGNGSSSGSGDDGGSATDASGDDATVDGGAGSDAASGDDGGAASDASDRDASTTFACGPTVRCDPATQYCYVAPSTILTASEPIIIVGTDGGTTASRYSCVALPACDASDPCICIQGGAQATLITPIPSCSCNDSKGDITRTCNGGVL